VANKKIEEYFVPWMDGQKMYISEHIELAWKDPSLHRMMSNENPLPPSEKVLEAIQKYGAMANRYPDQGNVVRAKIAEINGLDGPGNVLLGNGSSEVYDMVWRSLLQVGDEVIQHTPCFGIYKLRCLVCGGKLVSTPMKRSSDGMLQFDPDAVLAAITPRTKAIVIANPNNPTGNFMPAKDFIRIAETGLPFLVDEAYVEYAGLEMSQVGLIKKYENVMVTRTMSKAYGLAGMRFGYLLAAKKVIDHIAATLIPWNVGTIPMWAALAAFEDTDALKERVTFNNRQIHKIGEELSSIPGLIVLPSQANYMLFDGTDTGKKGDDMIKFALGKGIILRGQEVLFGRDGWWRLTIGSEEENQLLIDVVKEFYA
jgi:histidinol-phosphate aminotransferase